MRKLFYDIMNDVHDASGISDPDIFMWGITNGVYYPVGRVTEDEYHTLVHEWMDEVNLPMVSLDDVDFDLLTSEIQQKADWLLKLHHKI